MTAVCRVRPEVLDAIAHLPFVRVGAVVLPGDFGVAAGLLGAGSFRRGRPRGEARAGATTDNSLALSGSQWEAEDDLPGLTVEFVEAIEQAGNNL
jgi:hypothetical protein